MNLKKYIKNNLRNSKIDSNFLNIITKLKIHQINNQNASSAKNYRMLSNIEHSLFRYTNLLNANLTDEAEQEAYNLENLLDKESDITLKGGISNVKYIWQTEEGACEKCRTLDRTEYTTKEDIPEKPHPNCKCKIIEISDNEICDCYKYYEGIEDLVDSGNSLIEDIQNEIDDINNIKNEYSDTNNNEIVITIKDITSLSFPLETLLGVVASFVNNYILLLMEQDGTMDKYYHSKANCEAAQYGVIGSIYAEGLSNFKEYYDSFTYIHTHKVSKEKALMDSNADQNANHEGRNKGRNYPLDFCGDLMKHRVPEKKRPIY